MLSSSLCDYSDAYIVVKGIITVQNRATGGAPPGNRSKKVIAKSFVPFSDWISEINNIELDHAKDIDVVMPVCNLIEDSDNYLKTLYVCGNT